MITLVRMREYGRERGTERMFVRIIRVENKSKTENSDREKAVPKSVREVVETRIK